MAKAPPPKRGTKGAPPAAEEATSNLNIGVREDLVPLNFKVPAEFRRRFKIYASERDMSMKELLERSFQAYQEVSDE